MSFIKKEPVLSAAAVLAVLSMFFVAPSPEYLSYIDFRTLALLFSLMTVVAGLKEIGLFRYLGSSLLAGMHSTRQLAFTLTALCFFSSMLITNDVSLITVYNPADGSYQVYTAKDYLSQSGDSLTSVDSKVKEMASQGLIADQTQLKNKDFMEDKKYGIMIFGAFSAMGILLSLGLLLKKREGRK